MVFEWGFGLFVCRRFVLFLADVFWEDGFCVWRSWFFVDSFWGKLGIGKLFLVYFFRFLSLFFYYVVLVGVLGGTWRVDSLVFSGGVYVLGRRFGRYFLFIV